ncbi:MAG: 1,2-phenylacetyl-CoA epoxidase subunit PaaC [Streptosporangiaceae bacterium]
MSPTSDSPYDLLAEDHDDGHRWAFGTGFTDPLAGVDTSVPDGVDASALAASCLALGDDALIYSHRLQQWLTRMPELEEETAIANIALDLLGQARMLLARAGGILGRSEDQLAFFRDSDEFRNVRFVEPASRDFAELVGRLLIFSTWRLALFIELSGGPDPVLAAIAAKGALELTYHRDYAARWVVRLGDGTALSHDRMQRGLEAVWPLADELLRTDGVDAVLDSVFAAAGLQRPAAVPRTGRDGLHTEAMGDILAELQSVARAYPDATW